MIETYSGFGIKKKQYGSRGLCEVGLVVNNLVFTEPLGIQSSSDFEDQGFALSAGFMNLSGAQNSRRHSAVGRTGNYPSSSL